MDVPPPLTRGLRYPSFSLQTSLPLQNKQTTNGYRNQGPLKPLNMAAVQQISPGAENVVDSGNKGRIVNTAA